MKKILASSAVVVASLLLGACQSTLTGTSYSRDEVRQIQTVRLGTVIDVQLVQIEGTKTPVGTLAGGAIGGIAGSGIGGGRGSDIAAIAGAVAGGYLGSKAEEAMTRTQGVQLTIELQDGTFVSVVQEVQPGVSFAPGDHVKLLSGSGTTRVVQ